MKALHLYILSLMVSLASCWQDALAQDFSFDEESEGHKKAVEIQKNCKYWGIGYGESGLDDAERNLYNNMRSDITGYQKFEYEDNGEKVVLIYIGYDSPETTNAKPNQETTAKQETTYTGGTNDNTQSNDYADAKKSVNDDSYAYNDDYVEPAAMSAIENSIVDDLLEYKTYEEIAQYCSRRDYNQMDITYSKRNDGDGSFRLVFDQHGRLIALFDKSGKYDLLSQKPSSLEQYVNKNPILSISILNDY